MEAAETARKEAERFQFQIAQANERAANAEKEAARLSEIAEGEKLARLRIEQRLAPRTITSEQQERIRAKLTLFAGIPYELATSDSPEASALMITLDTLLHSSGWKYKPSENANIREVLNLSNGEEAERFLGTGLQIGVSKYLLQPEYKLAAKALVSALKAEGIEVTATVLRDNDPSPNAIHIMVGSKY